MLYDCLYLSLYIIYIYIQAKGKRDARTHPTFTLNYASYNIFSYQRIIIYCAGACSIYMYVCVFLTTSYTLIRVWRYDDYNNVYRYISIWNGGNARNSRFTKTHWILYAAISQTIEFLASRLEPRVLRGPECEQLSWWFREPNCILYTYTYQFNIYIILYLKRVNLCRVGPGFGTAAAAAGLRELWVWLWSGVGGHCRIALSKSVGGA